MIGCGLLLLEKLDQYSYATDQLTNELDQILYIVGGDQYIPQLSNDVETIALIADLPPRPEYIPIDLFAKLYSIPIKPDMLEAIRLSMFNKEAEWYQLLHSDPTTCTPIPLPWMEAVDKQMNYTLNDLVLLKTVLSSFVDLYLFKTTIQFIQSLPCLSLHDVLHVATTDQHTPLLVLYNDKDIISQANTLVFDDIITNSDSVSINESHT